MTSLEAKVLRIVAATELYQRTPYMCIALDNLRNRDYGEYAEIKAKMRSEKIYCDGTHHEILSRTRAKVQSYVQTIGGVSCLTLVGALDNASGISLHGDSRQLTTELYSNWDSRPTAKGDIIQFVESHYDSNS